MIDALIVFALLLFVGLLIWKHFQDLPR